MNPTIQTNKVASEPVSEKISDKEIKISRTVTTTTVKNKENIFNVDFVRSQINSINKQRDMRKESLEKQLEENEKERIAEIEECELILAECEKAGIEIPEAETSETSNIVK